MHAIRQYVFGPAENLLYEEVPDPVPAAGQVLIAVEAAGVHLIDTAIRRGAAVGPFPLPELPMTPGREVAGTVEAVGPGVEAQWVGRRVVVHLGMASGGYAERAATAVAALHPLPDGLTAEAAVALIGTGRTAVGILDVAAITADDVVVVTAAAGGLGSLFLQSACHAGAFVVGVAGGPAKVNQALGLGADVAVDCLEAGWPDRVRAAVGDRAVTVALDGVGGALGRAVLDLLGVGGRLVLFGYSSGEPTELTSQDLIARSLTVTWGIGPRLLERRGGMRELERRALGEGAAGRLVPLLQRFALSDAATAHTALETRATVGKVVLLP